MFSLFVFLLLLPIVPRETIRFLPSHKHKQHIDVAGRNAWYALGLGKGFGVNLDELLACFRREGLDAGIVEVASDLYVLQPLHLFRNDALALNVAAVLDLDFGCLDDFFLALADAVQCAGKLGDMGSEVFQRELGTSDKLQQLAATLEWGSAQLFQRIVDECGLDGIVASEVEDALNLLEFLAIDVIALPACQPQLVSPLCEACVGIVLTEQDAVFRSGGEHAVGLVHAFRDKVVNEHADVGLVPAQGE